MKKYIPIISLLVFFLALAVFAVVPLLPVSAEEISDNAPIVTDSTEDTEETINTAEELKKWADKFWSLGISAVTSVGAIITVYAKFKSVKKTTDESAENSKQTLLALIAEEKTKWESVGKQLESYKQTLISGLDEQGIAFLAKMKEAVNELPITEIDSKIEGYKSKLDNYSKAMSAFSQIMICAVESAQLPQAQKEKIFLICNGIQAYLDEGTPETATPEEETNNEPQEKTE